VCGRPSGIGACPADHCLAGHPAPATRPGSGRRLWIPPGPRRSRWSPKWPCATGRSTGPSSNHPSRRQPPLYGRAVPPTRQLRVRVRQRVATWQPDVESPPHPSDRRTGPPRPGRRRSGARGCDPRMQQESQLSTATLAASAEECSRHGRSGPANTQRTSLGGTGPALSLLAPSPTGVCWTL
jgi:hypothetical protein